MLAAALAYAEAGLPVFPLKPGTKAPATGDGLKSATCNPATVRAWWERWPNANVAIRTGEPAGLVVLDVDTQHGGAGTLGKLEREHGLLPVTAKTLTGGGGSHYLFRHPGEELRNSAGKLGPGLDVRGDGGYIVAPPSVHENGRVYKWLRALERGIADPPTWLLEDPRQNGRAAEPVDELIPEGRRRQALLSLAGSMRRRGMDDVELLAALNAVNERRCSPPLPTGELEALARDVASRYEPDAAANSFSPSISHKSGEKEFVLLPVPLESLLENVPPEPAWVLRGYVAPFALTLLAGRPKVGKSTLLFSLLARVTVGEPFIDLETLSAGALLLSEERRDTLAEKARITGLNSFPQPSPSIGGNERKPVHVLMRHDAGSAPWPEVVRQAIAYAHTHSLGVLVVDTWDRWTNLRGDSENAAGSVNSALEPLQFAAASGLAVLIVTHQRKGFGEYGEAVRGSNALTGGVDVVAELERPAASLALGKQARVLRAVSRFSSTPDELYLELDIDEGMFRRIERPEEVKADVDRERILQLLAELGEATANTVADEAELPEPTVRRHLKMLRERELVTRTGAGKKGDPHLWQATRGDEAA
jgi:DNA-binding transcriptional ArsR family regulator